ncbi:MAG: hypothetical protein H0U35_04335 [Sporichthyaceae bacterium]|nr:hypothetical protein [Sporichthyaceae bacterium]
MLGSTGALFRSCLLACCLLTVVTSCSDEPTPPGTLPSDTASPTTSSASSAPSSSPKPTTPEEEIRAAMVAYFEAANEMFRTGDVRELRSLSTDGCPCRKITRSVERIALEGGRYNGTRYDVKKIRVHDIEGETGLAEVIAVVPPYRVIGGDGSIVEDSPGGRLHTDFSLFREGEQWIVGNALNLE